MKRSEKIEVRLSHEEKQSLSSIADSEGRTVSDLVRGLIERYVNLNTARLPLKRRWGLWAGLVAGGLLIGHLGTYAFTTSHKGAPIYTMDFLMRNGSEKPFSISAPVVAKDGYRSELVIPGPDSKIRLTASVTERSSELAFLSVHICKEVETLCETIATPKLNFNPKTHATIRFGTEGVKEIYIRVAPEIQKPSVL